jgi:hypothetical protein
VSEGSVRSYTELIATLTDSCRVTQEFCDTKRLAWLNEPYNPANDCHDCVLGSFADDLSSPLGYDAEYEQQFQSLTSSCQKFTYSYTTPPAFTRTPPTPVGTTTTTPLATPSCRAIHTVTANDDCSTIAEQYGVSTFQLTTMNDLTPSCQLLRTGMQLCIGAQCDTHRVGRDETCEALLASYATSMDPHQFRVWNPNIDALCSNLHDIAGMVVCVR